VPHDDPGDNNPYKDQTAANTGTGWLDQTPVDIDLSGMAEYAKNVMKIQENLNNHTSRLQDLASLPSQALAGSLPEGDYMAACLSGNYAELSQYFGYLALGLQNVAIAAQTVADAYSSTDGWSAATLSTVNFAFAQPNAKRPPGLPPWVTGQTFWEKYLADQEKGTPEGPAPDESQWVNQPAVTNADGTVTNSAIAPDGRRREIVNSYDPVNGEIIVTTSLYAPDGKLLNRSSTRQSSVPVEGGSATTTRTFDDKGQFTGTKTETKSSSANAVSDSTVTSDKDGKNQHTSTTVTTTDSTTHTQVVTVIQDGKTVSTTAIGAQTDGVPLTGTSTPVGDAIQDAKTQADKEDKEQAQ
jgi:hypothetical protein